MATREPGSGAGGAQKVPPPTFVEMLLKNPFRMKILRLLEQDPGMNKHQLAVVLGLRVGAIEFHVDRLVAAGLIETRPGPGRETLCFRTQDATLWDDPATRMLYGRGPAKQVALFLAGHPGVGSQEVAETLDLSIHTVRRHLQLLQENELIQKMRVERQVVYHAEPTLLEWIEAAQKETGEKWRR